MIYWKENLSFFEKNAKNVYPKMVAKDVEDNIRCVWHENEKLLTIKQGKKEIWSGSTFDREREAQKAFLHCDKNAGLVLIMGIGNINLILDSKKHFKNLKKIIIFEPSINIFKKIMENIPFKKILAELGVPVSMIVDEDMNNVELVCNIDVTENPTDTFSVVVPIAYSQLFSHYRNSVLQISKTIEFHKQITMHTAKHFRYSWVINEWRNLNIVSPDASVLSGLFKTLPSIIVSAGPSLNKNIHLLKMVGDRALIFAVGSAVKVLDAHGIKPHFRVSVDGSAVQTRIFQDICEDDSVLLYSDLLYYEVTQKYENNCIRMPLYTGNHLQRYACRFWNKDIVETSTGPSVANALVFLALYFGCQKMILLGQDLCYTDNKNYADGSWVNKKDNEQITFAQDRILVKNIYGQDVFTKSAYLNMKKVFENAAEWYPDVSFINATEGGLNISGYENKIFSQVLQQDMSSKSIDIRKSLADIFKNNSNKNAFKKSQIGKAVKQMKKELLLLKEQNNTLNNLTSQNFEENQERIEKYIYKMAQNFIYKDTFNNFFQMEETALKKKLSNEDSAGKKNALIEFIGKNDENIDFLISMADELLSGEEKQRFIFWV